MASVFKVFSGQIGTLYDEKRNEEIPTAINKQEVTESVFVTKLGLTNDEQADKKAHGGPDKAVFMYPTYHYEEFWTPKYKEMTVGAFGENISVRGLDETEVCIGDIYKMGDVLIEVSQPRKPCFKPNLRFGSREIVMDTINNQLTGWYVRVLKEGEVKQGDPIVLMARPNPFYTIERCVNIIHLQKDNLFGVEDLMKVEQLADSVKQILQKKMDQLSN